MKDEEKAAFARFWITDPQAPTFQNATESYLAVKGAGDVSRESARRAGIRLMKDPYVQQVIAECRAGAKAQGALTLAEFVTWGWEALGEMRELMKVDPKYATPIPNLFDRVGRAMGFMVQRVEDVTPPERRGLPPAGSPEYIASAREALDRMERLNKPNPLPRVIAATIAKEEAELEADFETVDDEEDDANAATTE